MERQKLLTKAEIDTNMIREKMGVIPLTLTQVDPETGESNEITMMDYLPLEEIQKVIFIEEWYYDSKTMAITKNVKGVAPVRTYYELDIYANPIESKEEVVFVVYFNE